MSKIPNWRELTDAERVKTIRVISKRNAARKAALLAHEVCLISGETLHG